MITYIINLTEHEQQKIDLEKGQTYCIPDDYIIHRHFIEDDFDILLIKRIKNE